MVGVGLSELVVECGEQAQRPVVVGQGVVVAAQPGTGPTDSAMGFGQATAVTPLLGGGQGSALGGGELAPLPTPVQDRLHFAAFDVITRDRARLVELLKEWTAAAARMTQGQDAGLCVPGQPPTDSGCVFMDSTELSVYGAAA